MDAGEAAARGGTTGRNREIVELHRAGLTMQEIGDYFGITRERVRQIVRREDADPASRSTARVREGERVRLRIGNLAKAVLVTGQAYQDPKDALNEFVSNAADDYAEAGRRGERIRVLLRRKGRRAGHRRRRRRPRDVPGSAAASGAQPVRVGEGRRRPHPRREGDRAARVPAARWALRDRLASRKTATRRGRCASSGATRRRRPRARAAAGTRSCPGRRCSSPSSTRGRAGADPTQGRRLPASPARRGDRRGDYSIEVVEGRTGELVTPDEPERTAHPARRATTRCGDGSSSPSTSPPTPTVAVASPSSGEPARRSSTTSPSSTSSTTNRGHRARSRAGSSSRRCSRSAGRRAILRDDEMRFPVFRDAVQSSSLSSRRTIERVRAETSMRQTADRLSDAVRRSSGEY